LVTGLIIGAAVLFLALVEWRSLRMERTIERHRAHYETTIREMHGDIVERMSGVIDQQASMLLTNQRDGAMERAALINPQATATDAGWDRYNLGSIDEAELQQEREFEESLRGPDREHAGPSGQPREPAAGPGAGAGDDGDGAPAWGIPDLLRHLRARTTGRFGELGYGEALELINAGTGH
jgi:hypothetical protein